MRSYSFELTSSGTVYNLHTLVVADEADDQILDDGWQTWIIQADRDNTDVVIVGGSNETSTVIEGIRLNGGDSITVANTPAAHINLEGEAAAQIVNVIRYNQKH